MPGEGRVELVHHVEVDRGVLLVVRREWHLTTEEEDARHRGGDRALEGCDGEGGDLRERWRTWG